MPQKYQVTVASLTLCISRAVRMVAERYSFLPAGTECSGRSLIIRTSPCMGVIRISTVSAFRKA